VKPLPPVKIHTCIASTMLLSSQIRDQRSQSGFTLFLPFQARARGIIPPDERPVKYNPNPIGITQALQAVGATVPGNEVDLEPSKEVCLLRVYLPNRFLLAGSPAYYLRRLTSFYIQEHIIANSRDLIIKTHGYCCDIKHIA